MTQNYNIITKVPTSYKENYLVTIFSKGWRKNNAIDGIKEITLMKINRCQAHKV